MMNSAERKILAGLQKAAKYFRDGQDPDDAIVKAASEENLNPEMVKRVVERFNIDLTNSTISRASDKTASFPIAHADKILKQAFVDSDLQPAKEPEEPKTASGLIIERPEKKVAFLTLEEPKPILELGQWVKQISSLLDGANSKLASLGVDICGYEMKTAAAMNEVVDWFQLSGNQAKWASFEEDVLVNYGPQLKIALDTIHSAVNLPMPRLTTEPKVASAGGTPAHQAFDEFVEWTNAWTSAQVERQKLASEINENVEKSNTSLLKIYGYEKKARTAEDLIDFSFAGRKQGSVLPGVPPSAMLGLATQGASDSLGSQFGAAHEHAAKQKITGPRDQVRMEGDNIKRQAILQELMSNDEQLSKADPHGIQSAYNVLLHLAPDATLNGSVTAGFLRSALAQQAVDPFTATQLSQLQGQIEKNKLLAKGIVPKPGL